MKIFKILWVDDEIDYLKPHILFLENKNYKVFTTNNGLDAIQMVNNQQIDVVLLDENMPGLNGIETLTELKKNNPEVSVIMITKNEAEQIMDDAIGRKISDYLLKPVNPNQILISLKKVLNIDNLVEEKTIQSYLEEYKNISESLSNINSYDEWIILYEKMTYWELELESLNDQAMFDIFKNQMKEANSKFSSFIANNYSYWIRDKKNQFLLSNNIFKKKIYPFLKDNQPCILLLIDNLRLDQWKAISPLIQKYFDIVEDLCYFSILPSATQYSRNSFFSGLTPKQIQDQLPQWWKKDDEDGGKNLYESNFLEFQLKKLNNKLKYSYNKITSISEGQKLIKNINKFKSENLSVIVYNFVDMMSHAKTEMEIIKELAPDNKAYRSLTLSWFKNSPLFEFIQLVSKEKLKLIITTDHGTINVEKPIEIRGKKETSSNLRYKSGRSMSYDEKKVVEVKNLDEYELPKSFMDSSFIFAKDNDYFIYKNNFNHFAKLYNNTFQHGGISLEEIIIPFATFTPKN